MLSHKPWNGQAVFRLFLGVFSTYCVGNIIASLLYQHKLGMSDDTRRVLSLIVSLLFLQVAAIVWITFFLRENAMTWKQGFGFGRKGSGFAIGIGILAGMLVLPIAQELILISESVMLHFKIQPVAQTVVQELQKPQVPGVERAFIALLAIIGAPIVEESLFRGLLYPTLKQNGFPRIAFWGTSIVFAAFHVSTVTFVPLVFFAVVLILLYEATDNLLAPIAAHSVFNFANFLLLVFQDQLNSALPPSSPVH
jgi:membrane protease YdiL (CAAX protease family)